MWGEKQEPNICCRVGVLNSQVSAEPHPPQQAENGLAGDPGHGANLGHLAFFGDQDELHPAITKH
jgi:hypothetical protein